MPQQDRELTEALVLGKAKVSSLADVKKLNLWAQYVTDVSIFKRMPNVEVLSLSINCITTLKDFAGCRALRELYLRKNEVEDLASVGFLKNLPELSVLWLNDNPCAAHPLYRVFVVRMLPHLMKLDDTDVTPEERASAAMVRDPDLDALIARANTLAAGGHSAQPHSARSSASAIAPGPVAKQRSSDSATEDGKAAAAAAPAPAVASSPYAPLAVGSGAPLVRPSPRTQNILLAVSTLLHELDAAGLHAIKTQCEEMLAKRG